jgi:hypothetical protein
MNVGYQRNFRLLDDFGKCFRVRTRRHRQPNQPAPRLGQLLYLPNAPRHVRRKHLRHRLYHNRRRRPDFHAADINRPCFISLEHKLIVACRNQPIKLKCLYWNDGFVEFLV